MRLPAPARRRRAVQEVPERPVCDRTFGAQPVAERGRTRTLLGVRGCGAGGRPAPSVLVLPKCGV